MQEKNPGGVFFRKVLFIYHQVIKLKWVALTMIGG